VKPIPDRQNLLEKFIATYFPEPDRPETNGHARPSGVAGLPTDAQVIEKCRGAKNATKFADLCDHGDVDVYHVDDDSRADLSLMGIIAFYTQDEPQLERLFSGSALGQRPKWRNRRDYRTRTIRKALADLDETYAWGASSHSHPPKG
jgi:primase-polymerase (primpol)-like protein